MNLCGNDHFPGRHINVCYQKFPKQHYIEAKGIALLHRGLRNFCDMTNTVCGNYFTFRNQIVVSC